jgi:protein subunit release factor B
MVSGVEAQDWTELLTSFYLTDANNSSSTFEQQEASNIYNAQGDPSEV